MKRNQHVVPKGNKWAVRAEKAIKYTWTGNTQREAIDIARTIAINESSEVVIHRKDGKVRDRDGYGNAPPPPRDKKH